MDFTPNLTVLFQINEHAFWSSVFPTENYLRERARERGKRGEEISSIPKSGRAVSASELPRALLRRSSLKGGKSSLHRKGKPSFPGKSSHSHSYSLNGAWLYWRSCPGFPLLPGLVRHSQALGLRLQSRLLQPGHRWKQARWWKVRGLLLFED